MQLSFHKALTEGSSAASEAGGTPQAEEQKNSKPASIDHNLSPKASQRWIKRDNLRFHLGHARNGILVVQSTDVAEDEDAKQSETKDCLATGTSLTLGSRRFLLTTTQKPEAQKARKLLAPLKQWLVTTEEKHAESDNNKTLNLPAEHKDAVDETKSSEPVFESELRRSEVFLPVTLLVQGKPVKIYMYPSISKSAGEFKFEGFEGFTTAGCMLGSSVLGKDNKDTERSFVKHDLEFFLEQKITTVSYREPTKNPYEEYLLGELEKLAAFIDKCSAPGKPKQLLYHLPYYDYILFGVELFIRGRIELAALGKFFRLVLRKKIEFSKKIQAICDKHNIRVCIESPFENLFAPIKEKLDEDLEKTSPRDLLEKILTLLELPHQEIKAAVSPKEISAQHEKEQKLVQRCLTALVTNPHNKAHQEVWKDFLGAKVSSTKKTSGDCIINTEGLFKIANAIMIAIASKGKKPHQICSWLPSTEKQIHVAYAELVKDSTLKEKYSSVFLACVMDSVISYSNSNNSRNKGMLFYQGAESLSELTELVRKFNQIGQDATPETIINSLTLKM